MNRIFIWGSTSRILSTMRMPSITGITASVITRQILRWFLVKHSRPLLPGSIAKMLFQTIGMFYGFHGRPCLWGSGDIGPCRKGLKNEFRNGTRPTDEPSAYQRFLTLQHAGLGISLGRKSKGGPARIDCHLTPNTLS